MVNFYALKYTQGVYFRAQFFPRNDLAAGLIINSFQFQLLRGCQIYLDFFKLGL
jgi:hypothetical protein